MKRLATSCLLLLSSTGFGFAIFPLDIFNNDNITRTQAVANDLRWVVAVTMGGSACTGSMLSPKYVLTAHHCGARAGQTYTSGGCLELGCRGDLEAVRVVETYSSFDSTILEVRWKRKDSRWRQRYAPRVQTSQDEVTTGRDGEGTELFTVGFPADKEQPMHALGYAKSRSGNNLQYNVASINGNSGGAVWKRDDYTLVSQTNHGPHQLGQPGWKNNDPEDSRAWNGGPQMHLVYQQSATLKSIFPGGVNTNVSVEGYLLFDVEPPPLDP